MSLDFFALDSLRSNNPAWRLLRSDHAPLIASFLYRVFMVPNTRVMAAADLAEALEDTLYSLRESLGSSAFPKSAMAYLNDWAEEDKGWLRKFYKPGTDEPQFDITPPTEKVITWLTQLTERQFVGTESRLLTLFNLLQQIRDGSETDPEKRLAELQRQRDAIDAQMARITDGDVPILDASAVKDRFQQFLQGARELLADFRQVEQNFRQLDRHVRRRITLWDGSKGELLDEVMGERDAIADSDEGRSFRAFWEFLLSSRRQEELDKLLDEVLALPAIAEQTPDARLRRIHFDWMEAGEHTQRTVAMLSQQLRRFLDDQAWLENRRIMDILRQIEGRATSLRGALPRGEFITLDDTRCRVELPFERPLHTPAWRTPLATQAVELGDEAVDPAALFDQVVVDKARLQRHIRQSLQTRDQITLAELVATQPLHHGLAELIAYLQLGSESWHLTMVEDTPEPIRWQGISPEGKAVTREAKMPRILFVRRSSMAEVK